jgi:hypothetical protein
MVVTRARLPPHLCLHFEAGDVSVVCAALSAGRTAPSPRVPVAIMNIAASRIAAVSATVTSAVGVFIVVPSRCGSPRVVAKIASGPGKLIFRLGRNRHRHADPHRKHREGDDQAKRQRAERQRGRNGVVQSGRGNGRGAAVKARCAWRPDHGLNPSRRVRISTAPRDFFAEIAGNIGAGPAGKRRNDGKRPIMPAILAVMPAFPAIPRFLGLGGKSGRLIDVSVRPPIHVHEAGDLLDAP